MEKKSHELIEAWHAADDADDTDARARIGREMLTRFPNRPGCVRRAAFDGLLDGGAQ